LSDREAITSQSLSAWLDRQNCCALWCSVDWLATTNRRGIFRRHRWKACRL